MKQEHKASFAQFMRGLRVQGNVVGALLMREIHTRYGRDNIGYLWLFGEPLLLASAVASIHATEKSHYGSDIRPIPFAILGYCLFIMFRGMVSRGEGTLEANMPLLYHRTVTVFDMMFARSLLEASSTFMAYMVLMGFAISMGLADFPSRPLEFLIGVGLLYLWSFSISTLVCAATHDNKLVARLVHPATYILMPLSGAFFVLEWVPEPYRSWIVKFPMIQIFEQLRYGQFGSARNDYVDLTYIFGWCLILTYSGLVSMKIVRRHVHLH